MCRKCLRALEECSKILRVRIDQLPKVIKRFKEETEEMKRKMES